MLCSKGRAGSSPAFGTKSSFELETKPLFRFGDRGFCFFVHNLAVKEKLEPDFSDSSF